MENKINSLLILTHCRGLGRVGVRKLIEQFGSAENVVQQGWNKEKNLLFNKWEVGDFRKDKDSAEKNGIHLITYCDPCYPKNLLNTPDFPLILYVKGQLPSEKSSLAIIGTRNATLYGKQMAEKIAQDVAAAGVVVISGLARGIDTAAHQGALQANGLTVAIIGSGLSNIYPQENRSLAEKIADSGAVVSEYPMDMAPAKGLFPQRNRIVSGMSHGVFLVESPLEGGGMITMRTAEAQKKPLFTIPARLDWPTFEGNHLLLKLQKARLVENASDLLKHLNIVENQEVKIQKPQIFTPAEEAFLKLLPAEEKSIEELVLLTQLPVMQLNVLLTRLVLKKVVKEFPGKIYKKI